MEINFTGYNENVLTFECASGVSAGDLVTMNASGKVAKAAADSVFIGKCLSVRDGYAAVQLSGYVEAAKTGTVDVGYNKLVSSGTGVKAASSGTERLVIFSNSTTVGFIL